MWMFRFVPNIVICVLTWAKPNNKYLLSNRLIGSALGWVELNWLIRLSLKESTSSRTSDYLINMLQVLQNWAARFVTQNDIFTSQKQLLLQCGWMSVRQLVIYHDMVQIFKTLSEQKPVSLFKSLSKSFTQRTRAASTGGLVDNYRTTRDITKESFLVRSTKVWNSLPPATRQAENLRKFKFKLKAWIKLHVTQ
jgi:hypothetical protein